MATFGEVIYMVLDILKERVDDAYYTEEHIAFLASKMRALLLDRKYKNSRNTVYSVMSDENEQEICLNLEPTDVLPDGCAGPWLHSIEKIPTTLGSTEPKISIVSDMINTMVTYIPAERMPYVGYNKWLKNIVYAARSNDGHLYLNGRNPQFMYLKKAKVSGVFSDPEEAAKLACDPDGNPSGCDILDTKFPLEEALVPSCIEMVVQELVGSRYAPEDKGNNAKDDFAEANVTTAKPKNPAQTVASQREEAE